MIIQALDIVTTAAILCLVAMGLLVVFGVMKIINLAHGAFLAIGGYTAVVATQLGWNPWIAFLVAPAVGVLVGMLVEVTVVRPLYGRPLDTILATWGLAIVITQVLTLAFGRQVQFVASPVSGAVALGGLTYSAYRLLLVLVAAGVGLAVFLLARFTQAGLVSRAVIMNEELAQTLGINTRLVRFATFSTGAGLASLAGAMITPLTSVDPNMGVPWLVNAFMLVLLSGVSLVSLAVAALVLGGSQVLVSAYGNAVLGGLTIVVLAVLILRLRPAGFSRD